MQPDIDRRSDGSEGTDVEEPFTPSATSVKDSFDLALDKCTSPVSHSPPEIISPSREMALKETLSPVYEPSTDIKKIAVGHSPTDFIIEEEPEELVSPVVEQEVEEVASLGFDKEAIKSELGDTRVQPTTIGSPGEAEAIVACQDSSTSEMIGEMVSSEVADSGPQQAAPKPKKSKSKKGQGPASEYMSFDNMAFAGKEKIDMEQSGSDETSESSSEDEKEAPVVKEQAARVHLDIDVDKSLTEEEDQTQRDAAEESALTPTSDVQTSHPPMLVTQVSEPHEDLDAAYQASVIDTIVDRCSHDFDQMTSELQVEPTGFRIGQIEYHEPQSENEHRPATRTVSSESSSDTMVASSIAASHVTSLETSVDSKLADQPDIGESDITEQDRPDIGESDVPEQDKPVIGESDVTEQDEPEFESDPPEQEKPDPESDIPEQDKPESGVPVQDRSPELTGELKDNQASEEAKVTESLADSQSKIKSKTDEPESLDSRDDVTMPESSMPLVQVLSSESTREVIVGETSKRIVSEDSVDRTESASLDSEDDLEESYGDQRDELAAEMQVHITPSPQPPQHEPATGEVEDDHEDKEKEEESEEEEKSKESDEEDKSRKDKNDDDDDDDDDHHGAEGEQGHEDKPHSDHEPDVDEEPEEDSEPDQQHEPDRRDEGGEEDKHEKTAFVFDDAIVEEPIHDQIQGEYESHPQETPEEKTKVHAVMIAEIPVTDLITKPEPEIHPELCEEEESIHQTEVEEPLPAPTDVFDRNKEEPTDKTDKLEVSDETPTFHMDIESHEDTLETDSVEVQTMSRSDIVYKPVESLSSEEHVKTSSSSDASAEPTLLAATYDLDSGAISRVVASYDLSPDTIEKTLTVDSHPKAILSSPEDEVFEGETSVDHPRFEMMPHVDPQREATIPEEEEPVSSSSPFEMVSQEDLSGFEEFENAAASAVPQMSITPQFGIAVETEPVPFEVGETALARSHLEDESPSFDHSSPVSSEPSDIRGPISPQQASPQESYQAGIAFGVVFDAPIGAEDMELESDHSPAEAHYIHANGPTEVEYLPEHDDVLDEPPSYYAPPPPLFSQDHSEVVVPEAPLYQEPAMAEAAAEECQAQPDDDILLPVRAECVADDQARGSIEEESDIEDEPDYEDEETARHSLADEPTMTESMAEVTASETAAYNALVGSQKSDTPVMADSFESQGLVMETSGTTTGESHLTESIMEELTKPDTDKMVASDQTLYNLEMPSEEVSSQLTPIEPHEGHKLDTEEVEPEDSIGRNISEIPEDYASASLSVDQLTEGLGDSPDSSTMFDISHSAAISAVPMEYAQDAVITESEAEVYDRDQVTGVYIESTSGVIDQRSIEEDEPEDELVALQDDETTDQSPGQEEASVLPPQEERPQSPEPEDVDGYLDDETPDNTPSITVDANVLEQQASAFVQSVMVEAKATISAESSRKGDVEPVADFVMPRRESLFEEHEVHRDYDSSGSDGLEKHESEGVEPPAPESCDSQTHEPEEEFVPVTSVPIVPIEIVEKHEYEEAISSEQEILHETSDLVPEESPVPIEQDLKQEVIEQKEPETVEVKQEAETETTTSEICESDEAKQEVPTSPTEESKPEPEKKPPEDIPAIMITQHGEDKDASQDVESPDRSQETEIEVEVIREVVPVVCDLAEIPTMEGITDSDESESTMAVVPVATTPAVPEEKIEVSSSAKSESVEVKEEVPVESHDTGSEDELVDLSADADAIREAQEPAAKKVEEEFKPEDEEQTSGCSSPEHSKAYSEAGSDITSIATVISMEGQMQMSMEVHSPEPEDFGESSSVDSFATVVPFPDHEPYGPLEDRLAEIASMTSSGHSESQFPQEPPEPSVATDVRDSEDAEDRLSDSSAGSDNFEIIEKNDLESAPESSKSDSPDDDEKYDIIQREEFEIITTKETDYIHFPRRELEGIKEESESDQKDSTTTSSSERLATSTTSSSDRLVSSPDAPTHSPDIHEKGRFFNKSGERDDVSVSSSLLEFEHLEQEMQSKSSSESSMPLEYHMSSPRAIIARSWEREHHSRSWEPEQQSSVSSSLAEFERLESQMTTGSLDDKNMVVTTSRESSSIEIGCGSTASLNEFERLEKQINTDALGGKSSQSSSGSNVASSSNSSLSEFERLEQQMLVDEELQAEAQKVVSMLESGALLSEASLASSPNASSKSSNSASARDLTISREQLAEPPILLEGDTGSQEAMERDSLSDPEEEQEGTREAAATVETTEAVLISRQLQEVIRSAPCESEETKQEPDVDSLDSQDEEEELQEDQAIAEPLFISHVPNIGIVPAEKQTHEIDQDSLQGSESRSQSGALDSDSLQDQDSVMQISAESFEFDPVGPKMSSSCGSDQGEMYMQSAVCAAQVMQSMEPQGVMERSVDSLELEPEPRRGNIMETSADSLQQGNIMELSTDSLQREGVMETSTDSLQQGQGLMETSTDSLEIGDSATGGDSYDCDISQDSQHIVSRTTRTESWDNAGRHEVVTHSSVMEMSCESGAWSQSSSILSQSTIRSSDSRDIMRMSVDSPDVDSMRSHGEGGMDSHQASRRFSEGKDDSEAYEDESTLKAPLLSSTPIATASPPHGQPFQGSPQQTQSPGSSPTSESSHSENCYCGPEFSAAAGAPPRRLDERAILGRSGGSSASVCTGVAV